MRCTECQCENREGRRFCAECGAPLALACPSCGFANEAREKFCGGCGMHLTEQTPAPQSQSLAPRAQAPRSYTPRHLAERILAEQAALEARGDPDGERKTITALFADIKGSMDLLEDLDPEEARRLIDPALQLMMQAVHRYEGYVAQSLGDGIFALFGAPIAHEDHAQRALYAALRMQEDLKRYADQLRLEQGVPLQIRVGLNTGEVVVRSIRTDDLHTDYVPIGHATSLAARMQSLATPGSILISEPTYQLIEGYFQCQPLGQAQVKGVREPVPIYEVLGVGPLRTRLQVASQRGLARFVGRLRELELMRAALERATRGQGQIVAVVGEPGVGKSRLCYEFKVSLPRGLLVLETFSVSHGKASPYLPLLALLKDYFQLTPQDTERRLREQVMGKLLALDRRLEDTLSYVLALLGDAEATATLAHMDPQIRRRRTLEAITHLVLRESLNQPLVLLIEDLHWLDSETEAWLQVLAERVASARLLLLVNYRPEYQHAWGSKSYYTQLRLNPLGREEAAELVTALLGESPDLGGLTQLMLARTEGNPFFLEELVQALLEQGVLLRAPASSPGAPAYVLTGPVPALHIPPTVQGVLAARIDRLSAEEKALLQLLAVIGKEFPLRLLLHVAGQPEAEVQGHLARLQAAEFLYARPAFPEPEYTFKHALTQEVAYNSLLLERRKALHERTAAAIEALFPDRLEEHYSELAHHYSRSGNAAKAVAYLQRAGQQAVQRSAHADAIAHLTAALELLQTFPETDERRRQEFLVQIGLGSALSASRGYGAPEVAAAYTRAYELGQHVGDAPQLLPVLWGLWFFAMGRAEYERAQELGEHLLHMGQRLQDPILLLAGHVATGLTLWYLGELAQACRHMEQSVSLYDPQQHRALAFLYGMDYGMFGRAWLGWSRLLQGYPNQGLQHSAEALRLAQEVAHPYTLASMLFFTAIAHLLRRDFHHTREQVEALIALATEKGMTLRAAQGALLRGWTLAMQGEADGGLAQMRQALSAWRATGAALSLSCFLGMLAEACGHAGQIEEGLHALDEALAHVDKAGERWYEAELHRLKGELLCRYTTVQEAQAETCFQQALAVARGQGAKWWELRAALSLSRLWQRQGKRAEARELLTEIYGWFTEGFETADLQDAKALLDELA